MISIVSYRPLAVNYEVLPPFANTKSLSFDGVDDYLDCGNVWNLSTYTWSPFTLSFWYKGTNPIVGAVHLLSLLKFAPSQFLGLYDGYTGAANVKLYLNFGGLNIAWTVGSNGTVDLFDDQWHNVTIVFPPGSNDGVDATNAQMYIDNTLMAKVGSGIISAPGVSQTWNTFQIMEGEWNPLGGLVDEVALWKTDETSSVENIYNLGTPTDLTDLNPTVWFRNGDNGSWKSPQWLIPNNENKDKVSNYSMYFDGLDDSINIGNISSLQSTSNFSISFWMKRDITTLSARNVMGFWVSGTNVIQFYQGTTVVRFRVDGGYVNNTTSIVQPNWNHFTLVYDGSLTGNVNRAKIYFNGVDETVNEAGTVPAVTNVGGPDFEIGTVGGIVTTHANANLDEVAFFDYSLTPTEVLSIYNGGGTATPGDLTSLSPTNYYKMGEEASFNGTNWTIPDNVGSNTGTSANMTIEDRVGEAPNSTNNALSLNMDEVDRTTDVPR